MAETSGEVTEDEFIGGRLRLLQPRRGYRAATDPVLLAAACAAAPGESVLDLGCGVGAAALCLAARVSDVMLHGLELQASYAALAAENAARNGVTLDLHVGDVLDPPPAVRALNVDHVMMNPPYYSTGGLAPADQGRAVALRAEPGANGAWIEAGLKRLRPRGRLTAIILADRAVETLTALDRGAGDIAMLPLAAREGRMAKRVILTGRKGARGPFRLLAPFVLHAGPTHTADETDFTPEAQAVLRDGAALRQAGHKICRQQN